MRRWSHTDSLGAILFLCVIFLGIIVYPHFTERARLIDALQKIGVTSVQEDAVAIPLRGARTESLRLAWFTEAHRIDPILAIAGTDPEKLQNSLAFLKEKEDAFISYYSPSEQRILRDTLYPKFLASLPSLEAERVLLQKEPTEHGIDVYESTLEETLREYADDAERLAASIRASTSTDALFAYPNESTTVRVFTATLDSLQENAVMLKKKAAERYACYRYYSLRCASLEKLLLDRARSISIPEAIPSPDNDVYEADALARAFEGHVRPPVAARTFAPLVGIRASCYADPSTYTRVWWQALPEGNARKTSMTNDMYFITIEPEQNDVYRELYEDGARIKYQVTGHYYLCADSGEIVFAIGRILSLTSSLASTSIFSASQGEGALVSLAAHAQGLMDDTFIDEHDAAAFVKETAFVLAKDRPALEGHRGRDSTRALEDIVTLWQSGATEFDDVVREAAFENEFLSRFQKDKRIPLFSVLFIRSYPSIFFLTGNRTVVEKHAAFAHPDTTHPFVNFKMTSYNALIRAGSTTAEIISAISRTAELEKALRR